MTLPYNAAITTRIRAEVGTSVKGVKTYSVTVEMIGEGVTEDMVIEKSDSMVARMDAKYPGGDA